MTHGDSPFFDLGGCLEGGLEGGSSATDATCGICHDEVTEPRLLTCLHSFCKTCLADFKDGDIRCPLCKYVSDKPVTEMPLDCLKLLLQSNSSQCDFRTESNCDLKCHSTLLQQAVKQSFHCLQHPHLTAVFVCVSCNMEKTCVDCAHDRHRSHLLKSIRELAAAEADSIAKANVTVQQRLSELDDDAGDNQFLQRLQDNEDHVKQLIKYTYLKYQNILTKVRDTLLADLKEQHNAITFAYMERSENAEKYVRCLHDASNYSEELVNLSSGGDLNDLVILQMANPVKRGLSAIFKNPLTSEEKRLEELDFQPGVEDPEKIIAEAFGKVVTKAPENCADQPNTPLYNSSIRDISNKSNIVVKAYPELCDNNKDAKEDVFGKSHDTSPPAAPTDQEVQDLNLMEEMTNNLLMNDRSSLSPNSTSTGSIRSLDQAPDLAPPPVQRFNPLSALATAGPVPKLGPWDFSPDSGRESGASHLDERGILLTSPNLVPPSMTEDPTRYPPSDLTIRPPSSSSLIQRTSPRAAPETFEQPFPQGQYIPPAVRAQQPPPPPPVHLQQAMTNLIQLSTMMGENEAVPPPKEPPVELLTTTPDGDGGGLALAANIAALAKMNEASFDFHDFEGPSISRNFIPDWRARRSPSGPELEHMTRSITLEPNLPARGTSAFRLPEVPNPYAGLPEWCRGDPLGAVPPQLPMLGQNGEANYNQMQIRCRFGQLGSGRGMFNAPHGFCLGTDEDIVVADTNNHRIQVFDKNGAFRHQFGQAGKEEGCLWYPRKVAVIKSSGNFVICDRGGERSRMQIFSRHGHFLRKIPIRFIDIVAGLAISRDENIVAVDSVTPTIFVISDHGEVLRYHECSEFMAEPSDIAIGGTDYYICDFKGHSVVVVSEEGQFLRRIGNDVVTCFPNGIDISDAGDILIGDSHGNQFHVAVFDNSGQLVSQFQCPHVKVSRCCGLKITSEGYIVTLAKNNHHVLVLNTLYVS